jgi:two-component system, OmpR family, response regulator RstA
MDLVCARCRSYTVAVNHLLPHSSQRDASFDFGAPHERLAAAGEAPARCVQVLADDDTAAATWCEALHAEGLLTQYRMDNEETPLAVVLHITRRLPDRLGQLRELRARHPELPLLVVCQQLRDLDHVLALEMGADDVLDAGTSAAVVAARLRTATRRRSHKVPDGTSPDQLNFGALALNLRERRVQLQGADIALTEGEFEVLWLLASQAGRAVSRTELLRRLRGLPYQRIDRSIDCRIYRIRAKLNDADGPAQRIRTVRNCGYLFSPAAW